MLESFQAWVSESWPRLLGAVVIFGLGWFAGRQLVRLLIAAMKRAGVEPTLVSFLGSFLALAAVAVVLVAALTHLGVPTASMLAVLGAAGLAVALSLQNSLSNFASGVILSIFRPFKVGDVVDLNGEIGIVESIEIFYTHFRTPDNRGMVLPNSVIASNKLINLTAKDTRRIDLEIGVSYDDNLEHVLGVLRGIIGSDPRILPDPAPIIGVARFAESSINIWIRPWVKRADYLEVMLDLNLRIKQRFDEEGITIPFPQRDVHVIASEPKMKT
ncbi:MAG: mechanosensitive ion channel domain-containing protein [Verrucomicrobiia bacterium]